MKIFQKQLKNKLRKLIKKLNLEFLIKNNDEIPKSMEVPKINTLAIIQK